MIAKRGRCPGNTQGGGLFSFVRGIDQRTHQHEQVPGHIDDRLLGSSGALLVEARGVEPLSESTSTGTSPSADGRLHSLTQPQAVKLLSLVES